MKALGIGKCAECGAICTTTTDHCVHCGYRAPEGAICLYCRHYEWKKGCDLCFDFVEENEIPCPAYYDPEEAIKDRD